MDSSGDWSGEMHEWAKQFKEDLLELDRVACAWQVARAAERPLALFTDSEVREGFLAVDVRVLAAECKTARVPPPGTIVFAHKAPKQLDEEGRELFRCELRNEGGGVCMQAFLCQNFVS